MCVAVRDQSYRTAVIKDAVMDGCHGDSTFLPLYWLQVMSPEPGWQLSDQRCSGITSVQLEDAATLNTSLIKSTTRAAEAATAFILGSLSKEAIMGIIVKL